jgi:hypothetical protein
MHIQFLSIPNKNKDMIDMVLKNKYKLDKDHMLEHIILILQMNSLISLTKFSEHFLV